MRTDRPIACMRRSIINGAERRLHGRESGQDLECIADRQLLEWHALTLLPENIVNLRGMQRPEQIGPGILASPRLPICPDDSSEPVLWIVAGYFFRSDQGR